MATSTPVAELDPQFSSPEAKATQWAQARERLEKAEVYWLSTVRPDGRPHVTPLIAVWLDGALYFCTGPDERKAKNLAGNPRVVLTTGCNTFSDGLDVVIEGEATRRVSDRTRLERLAERFGSKYGPPFEFSVGEGVFLNDGGGEALVYEVAPLTAFGFDKGKQFSQTRWRFGGEQR
jgi:nitroimidazol reductase NimA-like FMN-containing flavoprotein (pyridoxamine 5'-phosphate oxidase superfamily)